MNSQQKIFNLVNKSIDGTASRRQQERLERLMAASSDVRNLFNEMKSVTTLLDGAREEPAPQHLKIKIMNTIGTHPVPKYRHESIIAQIQQRFLPRPGYAYAFAAGIILGVLMIILVFQARENSLDFSNLYGTMTSRELQMDRSIPLDIEGISGRIGVRNEEKGIVAELDLNTYKEVTIRISYNRDVVEFTGYRAIHGNIRSVIPGEHSADITLQGTNKNLMLFKRKSEQPSPLVISIFDGGREVFQQTLSSGM